jgi:molybdopterin-guanine dinucleotide biosynthesis protein A
MPAPAPRLAAVILSGGSGRRLGGVDKASIEVDGRALLEHVLTATAAAAEVVVVGPEMPTIRPVTWTREDPPGGGPAAGLLAGVDAFAVPPDLVCVVAVDMPGFTARTLRRLTGALEASAAEAACLVDRQGREQWLAGLYRYDALLAARPQGREAEHGLPVRRLVESLRFVTVEAEADEAHDIDTWEDLDDLRGSES